MSKIKEFIWYLEYPYKPNPGSEDPSFGFGFNISIQKYGFVLRDKSFRIKSKKEQSKDHVIGTNIFTITLKILIYQYKLCIYKSDKERLKLIK